LAEGPGKKDDKFEFTPEGESVEYISLGDARVMAIRHARENPEIYGDEYQGTSMVWRPVSQVEEEEFYEIQLSFQPAGIFTGTPGLEQFVISKTGIIELRQVLESPIPDNPRANVGSGNGGGGGSLKWLLFGGFSAAVIVVIILVTVIATAGSSGNDGKQQPIAAPLPNIDKTIEAGIQQGLAARVVTVPPTDQTEPPTERSGPPTDKPVLPNPEPSSSTPTFSVAFANKWGTEGTGGGQFYNPQDIAVASDGSVYVADERNNRIQKFTSEGEFILQWGGGQTNYIGGGQTNNGEFNGPWGVAVASDGSVYVADWGNHRIQKFTSGGLFVRKWGTWAKGDGEFNYPAGVAVAPDGSVYVADTGNHRIQKFTSDGLFVSLWGTEGTGGGQFYNPQDVALAPNGSVYVADTDNHRIQKFTSEGVFVSLWGTEGTSDGQFNGPWGVAVAPDGSVYVTDNNNHRIQKFTSGGRFVSKWGEFGTGDGRFNYPIGIAVASDGSVYVADLGNNRIQKFSVGP